MLHGGLDLNKQLSKEEINLQVVDKIRDLTDMINLEKSSNIGAPYDNNKNPKRNISDDLFMVSDPINNYNSDEDDSLDLGYHYYNENKENNNHALSNKNIMIGGQPIGNLDDKNQKQQKDIKYFDQQNPTDNINRQKSKSSCTALQFQNNQNQNNTKTSEMILIRKDTDSYESKHIVKANGITMGRNSANQIVVMDETVSRFHAEIEWRPSDNSFYLKDIGSTAGTYVIINRAMELHYGMIFEIGSYELKIKRINIKSGNNDYGKNLMNYEFNDLRADHGKFDSNNNFVEVTIEEGPEKEETEHIILEEGCIGRAIGNILSFPDDQHMSSRHCRIYCKNRKFYIEDCNSTNGTLLRLSCESSTSSGFRLEDNMKMRVGITQYFEVEKIIECD